MARVRLMSSRPIALVPSPPLVKLGQQIADWLIYGLILVAFAALTAGMVHRSEKLQCDQVDAAP